MCKMTEEIKCPKCERFATREEIIHWGQCAFCEHIEDEVNEERYIEKHEERYGLGHE